MQLVGDYSVSLHPYICVSVFRPPRCYHLHCYRRLVCGLGGGWAGLRHQRIPKTSEHHLDTVSSSACLLHTHICNLMLSGCQQESDNYMLNSARRNAICTAKLLFTWHWNVSKTMHKPHICGLNTCGQQRSVLQSKRAQLSLLQFTAE